LRHKTKGKSQMPRHGGTEGLRHKTKGKSQMPRHGGAEMPNIKIRGHGGVLRRRYWLEQAHLLLQKQKLTRRHGGTEKNKSE
jgi:hypothetical protein